MTKRIKLGQIVNTQGIKGEIRVYPLTDYKERFEEIKWLFIDETDQKLHIDKVRYKNDLVILKVQEINDMTTAEKYRNCYLTIDKSMARELPDDTYFICDLIGLKVFTDAGELVGNVKNVIQSAGNDIYEVEDIKNPQKIFLIPAVAAFVKHIDLKEGTMIITPIEGLIE
ncbi:MAG: ribosome maturation factor RimM [Bacillota bacterium]